MNGFSLKPLVAIMGTTGVGKSQLAVELAQLLVSREGYGRAKIINADAMQTYAGLDVLTNKISEEEKCGIEHLLIGVKQPGEEYVVGEWVEDALQEINVIHAEDGVPIAVGGTSYWIQNLILQSRLPSLSDGSFVGKERMAIPSSDLASLISALPENLSLLYGTLPSHPLSAAVEPDLCLSLHALLCHLDPAMGARWHWRDSRKVVRSIEIIKENGRRASEILADQQAAGISEPRFRTLVYWLYATPEKLEPRLDARVDEMLQKGLLTEIMSLHKVTATLHSEDGRSAKRDNKEGIFQSIGYKEFHEYLTTPEASPAVFETAVTAMKQATRQYSRRQVKWMKHKLLPAVSSANAAGGDVQVFILDASDLSNWDVSVKDLAADLLLRFLGGESLPAPESLSRVAQEMLGSISEAPAPLTTLEARRKRICAVCTAKPDRPIMIEEGAQWEAHVKSRSHRRLDRRQMREARLLVEETRTRRSPPPNGPPTHADHSVGMDDLFKAHG